MKPGPWIERLPFPHHLEHGTNRNLAHLAGVNRATIIRWKRDGVPHTSADLLADAFGLHPLNLWPNYHTAGNTCSKGHPWDGYEGHSGRRRCRTCNQASHRASYLRTKERAA